MAIETLSWIELRRLGEHLALAKAARQLKIQDKKALGLAHRLVFETLRRQNIIDSIISVALSPRSISDLHLGTQAFLRLFTYETKFEGTNVDKAAIIVRTGRSILGWRTLNDVEEALGLILSVDTAYILRNANEDKKVALQTYNPTWFVRYCFRMLGRSEAKNLLESTGQTLPTYLRVNTLKGSEKNIVDKIEEEGATIEKIPMLMHTFKLVKTERAIVRMKSFRDGLFYIQDKASCLATEIACPQAGSVVLDVCAAPGAKTTYMAQLMGNKGVICSIDYSKRRMDVWKSEVKRMGVEIAQPIVADTQHPLPIRLEADLVVLDPPCTSTGSFGKMPSAKWRLTKRSISRMADIQFNMMSNCAEYVKQGGFLVYSTCSITLEENEMIIEKFLKWHLDFALTETTPWIGSHAFRGQSQNQRLYPHIHQCNGFFIAKLARERS